jgi:SAM-dependent methyltransferase
MSEAVWAQRRTSFGSAAENYAAARPRYPRAILEWCLPPGATTVLDLAAGTGIIASSLLELGINDVVAVEPLAEMRGQIPTAARVLDGSAEAIPLPDASVDAILVGQAWHWFDATKALAETRRVLRSGGTLGLIWNLYDESDPTTKTFTDIVAADEERADWTIKEDVPPPFDDTSRFSRAERRLEPNVAPYDPQRVTALALSRSPAIVLEPAERQALVERLVRAMPAGDFEMHWICEAWRATAL